MDILETKIHTDCLPRYKYMLKIRKVLVRRYNGFMETYDMKQRKLREDVSGDTIQITLCKSKNSEHSLPDIESIVPRNCPAISTNKYEINNIGFEKMTKTSSIELPDGGALQCPKHILFIGKDIKTIALSDIYSRKENIDVCSEGTSKSLSTHLERYALTGMKEACENLHSLLTGKPLETDVDYKVQANCCPKCENLTSSKLRPLSAVIQNPSSQSLQPLSVDNGRPRSSNEQRTKEEAHCKSKIRKKITEIDREMMGRLFEEFVGVFNRSILPDDEKPRIVDEAYKIEENVLQQLRNLSSSIESCGYCCSTFQINVNTKDISQKLQTDIAHIMKSHNIARFSVVTAGIRELFTCKSGQQVKVEHMNGKYMSGTLSGFAKTSSEESERKWAILSRHVAKCSIDRRMYISKDGSNVEYCGEIMKEIREDETNKQYLDIAAASLEKDIRIDSNYVTEDGTPVPGKPFLDDPEKLRGVPVHIKGASTSIGLGVITMPKQVPVKIDNLDHNYIIVRDRNKNEAFVKEGDSGAMVLAENPDKFGEEVQLISVIVGERLGEEGSYVTVRLDKGLEQLKSLTDKDFDMC